MIRIDLRSKPKLPWRRTLRLVGSIGICSLLSLLVYTSWDYVEDSVKDFFETTEELDNGSVNNEDLNEPFVEDGSIVEAVGHLKRTVSNKDDSMGLNMERMDVDRDYGSKEQNTNSHDNDFSENFIDKTGLLKGVEAIDNCAIAFDLIEGLYSFAELELLVCGDKGIYEISGVIDSRNSLPNINDLADKYFEDVEIDSWENSNKKLFFSMSGVIRDKVMVERMALNKEQRSNFFLKAREHAETNCLEQITQSDEVIFESGMNGIQWRSKIMSIGSRAKCNAFLNSLRSLAPNVSVSEMVLTPITSGYAFNTEIRIGISLIALGFADR